MSDKDRLSSSESEMENKDWSDDDEDLISFKLAPISFQSLVGHCDEVNTCSFSPDWSLLVTGADDCLVKVWNTKTGEPLYTLVTHKGKNVFFFF